MAFSEDNYRLCSIMEDGAILRWNVHTGECLNALRGKHVIEVSAVLHRDEQCVYSTHDSRGIFLCDTQSGHFTELSMDYTKAIAIDPKLTKYASVSFQQEVSIFDLSTGFLLRRITCQTDEVLSVTFSHGSDQIAVGSAGGEIFIYDLTAGETSQIQQDHEVFTSMSWSPDSSQLVVISPSRSADIWDARTGQRVRFILHEDTLTWAAFSQSQPVRLATGSRDQVIKVWDLSKHECVLALTGHESWISPIAFSADSSQLVTTSADAVVKLWDLHTGQCTRTLEYGLLSREITQAVFSKDSKRVLIASVSVGIWYSDTFLRHENFAELGGLDHTFDQTAIAITSDNVSLAKSTLTGIEIWDLSQRKVTLELQCNMPAANLAFDDTGLYLDSSIGTIDITATIAQPERVFERPISPVYRGFSLDSFGAMITYNSRLLLWIPVEYRTDYLGFAVHGNAVATLDKAGRLWMYKFDLGQIEALVTGTNSDV